MQYPRIFKYPGTFTVTWLEDGNKTSEEIGQFAGVLKRRGEPNPFCNFSGKAEQRLMDVISRLPLEPHGYRLRISDSLEIMPAYIGYWMIKHNDGNSLEITSQGVIKSERITSQVSRT